MTQPLMDGVQGQICGNIASQQAAQSKLPPQWEWHSLGLTTLGQPCIGIFFFLNCLFPDLDYQPNVGQGFFLIYFPVLFAAICSFPKKVARRNCSNTVGSSRMAVQAKEEQLQRSWDGRMLGVFT